MSELAATTELITVPPRAVSATGGTPLKGVINGIRSFAAQPAVAKSLPALGLLAMLGLAFVMWVTFTAAPDRDLFRGLAEEEKGAVAEALQGAGIAYDVNRGTGALTVSEDDYHQARMLLAQQGLPKSAPDGQAMIEGMPLGASRAVEAERLRSGRELDLARTIEAIDAVQSARVHLAIEPPSVFLRERASAAASVMLRLAPGRALGDAQVQAIVHLVASSVPGLTPDGVSIVDQNGRLLSSEGNGGLAGVSERQVQVQGRIEDRYRESLVALLTPIVGEGNFTTEVHADVDFSEVQATREGYPKDASALRAEEGSFTTGANGGGEVGGIPGALANQAPPTPQATDTPPAPGMPGVAADAAARGNQNYNRSFAVGREVSVTKQQTGQVRRLSVAVALKNPDGKPRSKAELAGLEALVKGAIGFDAARGDVVALSSRAFAPVEEASETWWEAGWVSLLTRNLTALAIAALVIFGIAKPLMKKGGAIVAERARTASAARSVMGAEIAAALDGQGEGGGKVTLGMIEAANGYESRAALIRNFVRQDPARAALVVRDLIRADGKQGADNNG